MKPILPYILLAFLFLFAGCEEDLVTEPRYDVLQPLSTDSDGGTWQTILNIDPSALTVPAPADPQSTGYLAEVDELRELSSNRTAEQTAAVQKWGSGGALRWNRIARDLVAKYNVAPLPGAAPDPQRPFANPPVAARAYALLSVGQYDGLVAAWHHKYRFNRLPAAEYAADLESMIEAAGLPAYPSEHGVLAAVSSKVLAALFPLEQAYLEAEAEEHLRAMQWAGYHTTSDLEAGWAIGEQIAAAVLQRAGSDRFKTAGDPQNTYLNITVPYEPWRSINNPPIKPMLPLLGEVRTWFDSTRLMAEAFPPPPPAPGTPAYNEDIALVLDWATKRSREHWRIADYWADGAGTYTPPGHWNLIAEEHIRARQLSELRTARVYAALNRSQMDAAIICWRSKYVYYYPRPSQLEPRIKTATGIPNFPSYTSGHATFSGAAATVLGHLFPEAAATLAAQAEEAGLSRVVGGIHFQFDNIEGQKSGRAIGEIAIDWLQTDGGE